MYFYKFEENVFEPQKNKYSTPEKITKLSPSESKILQYLIDNSGDIVSREILLEIGWPGKIVVPNSLNVSIANLRKALRKNKNLLITIKGEGFTFSDNSFFKYEIESHPIDKSDFNDVLLSDNDEGEGTSNNKKLIRPHKLISIMKIVGYNSLFLAMFVWSILWLDNWQSPPCVMINKDQRICGNIELLNLNDSNKDIPKNDVIYVDNAGNLH